MSLIDKLMAIDSGAYAKEKTAKVKSNCLSEAIGEETMVTIKALSGEEYTDITMNMVDRKGRADFSKAYRQYKLICAAGVVEPDLKDAQLQKHFGVASPADLAAALFKGGELQDIAGEITKLSGFAPENEDEDEEAEVKN